MATTTTTTTTTTNTTTIIIITIAGVVVLVVRRLLPLSVRFVGRKSEAGRRTSFFFVVVVVVAGGARTNKRARLVLDSTPASPAQTSNQIAHWCVRHGRLRWQATVLGYAGRLRC